MGAVPSSFFFSSVFSLFSSFFSSGGAARKVSSLRIGPSKMLPDLRALLLHGPEVVLAVSGRQ